LAPPVFVVESPGKTSGISLRHGAIRVGHVRGEALQPLAMMLTLFPPARLWVCSECHLPLQERRPAVLKRGLFPNHRRTGRATLGGLQHAHRDGCCSWNQSEL